MSLIDFKSLYALEMAVIPVINTMESRGISWNSQLARREDKKIRRKMQALLESDTMASVNPNSPKQVKEHFLTIGMPEKLMLLKGKITTGQKQMEAAVRHLENDDKYQHVPKATAARVTAFSKVLTDFRHLAKVSGTYLRPFSDVAERTDGIVYASINPFGAVTGRMSGTFQQMPKADEAMTKEQQVVRRCVVCRDGYEMWFFDFSQMELYIFGAMALEYPILGAYDKGDDVHQKMADMIGQPRKKTKNITFGLIYGEGIKALADVLGVSMAEAKKVVELYHSEFPGIREYQNQLECELRVNGFVEDWYGRRYGLRPTESYKAVNANIQGVCASIFKTALCQTADVLRQDENLLLVVHDEIVIERKLGKPGRRGFVKRVLRAMTEIRELDERGLRLRVGCDSTVTSWAEKKAV